MRFDVHPGGGWEGWEMVRWPEVRELGEAEVQDS